MKQCIQKKSESSQYLNNKAVERMRKKLREYDADEKKEKRLKNQLCKHCTYVNTSQIGLSAMTTATCTECNKDMMFPSSVVDYLCPECAEKLNLCKHCGQEMD
jgi:predicted RNA-binding Zn-ribbon protein involved in translation (DUF1610 family)